MKLSPRQRFLLHAVAQGRVERQVLHGDLEPYVLNFDNVNWPLRMLTLRGLVRLHPWGPPTLSRKGRNLLQHQPIPDSPAPPTAQDCLAHPSKSDR